MIIFGVFSFLIFGIFLGSNNSMESFPKITTITLTQEGYNRLLNRIEKLEKEIKWLTERLGALENMLNESGSDMDYESSEDDTEIKGE